MFQARQSEITGNDNDGKASYERSSQDHEAGGSILCFFAAFRTAVRNAITFLRNFFSPIEPAQECKEIYSVDIDIETLEDALNFFKLSELIEKLDNSLEDVRRSKKAEEAHETFVKEVDQNILKLSRQFHPDKVVQRGGSDDEVKAAQKKQAAINAVRTALNMLNNAFLEDIDTDHKYGFYMKLKLSTLINANVVQNHVKEVLFKISLLSEIKQKKIIARIQQFLTNSELCVQSYLDHNLPDYKKQRNSALFCLNCCIEGHEKFQNELESVENECKVEKQQNVGSEICEMISENKKTLTILRNLKAITNKSGYRIFQTTEPLDEYFIQPLVYYVNIILMCDIMIEIKSSKSENNALQNSNVDLNFTDTFKHLHSLVLSVIKSEFNEELLNKNEKAQFDKYLAAYFNRILKDNFKKSDYIHNSISEELQKCMKMKSDFLTKEKEFLNVIEIHERKTELVNEKFENLMKKDEEVREMSKERLEKKTPLD